MEAATVATQLQGAPLPAAPHLAPAPHLRLAKAVKAQRKQLERSSRRRQSCGPLSFVQDDVRGAEAASAVVDQLLDQLRRLELHQVAPQGDGCTTLPLAAAAAATAAAPQQQQQQSMVRLRAVIDGDGGDPWEAGVDLSSELFAPRSYQVPGRVLVCQGSKCRAKGALGVLQAVSAVAAGSGSAVQVLPCKCLGKCKEGAVMRVKQEGVAKCAVYTQLQAELVPSVLDSHFLAPVAATSPDAGAAAGAADACCTDCHTTVPAVAAAAIA